MKQTDAGLNPTNLNIPAALHEIGMLLELKGGRYFKPVLMRLPLVCWQSLSPLSRH